MTIEITENTPKLTKDQPKKNPRRLVYPIQQLLLLRYRDPNQLRPIYMPAALAGIQQEENEQDYRP
ncbi:MAG: hypothetical protein LCH30_09695 [Proteobacteria bacterium]|nr:hypothetical protein [Pseudomonadota bacterium]